MHHTEADTMSRLKIGRIAATPPDRYLDPGEQRG